MVNKYAVALFLFFSLLSTACYSVVEFESGVYSWLESKSSVKSSSGFASDIKIYYEATPTLSFGIMFEDLSTETLTLTSFGFGLARYFKCWRISAHFLLTNEDDSLVDYGLRTDISYNFMITDHIRIGPRISLRKYWGNDHFFTFRPMFFSQYRF